MVGKVLGSVFLIVFFGWHHKSFGCFWKWHLESYMTRTSKSCVHVSPSVFFMTTTTLSCNKKTLLIALFVVWNRVCMLLVEWTTQRANRSCSKLSYLLMFFFGLYHIFEKGGRCSLRTRSALAPKFKSFLQISTNSFVSWSQENFDLVLYIHSWFKWVIRGSIANDRQILTKTFNRIVNVLELIISCNIW